jgi:PLP dependent protein
VGHLQSNKARKAASCFDVIHSLHAVDLGDALERASRDAGHPIELLAQVDLAGEPTKHGAREEHLAAMFEAARGWQTARLIGLMALPPAVDDPEQARPYFRALKSVRDRLLARGVDAAMLSELSMGMSHDFEVAVEEGATLVRVGTAIFGGRANV